MTEIDLLQQILTMLTESKDVVQSVTEVGSFLAGVITSFVVPLTWKG